MMSSRTAELSSEAGFLPVIAGIVGSSLVAALVVAQSDLAGRTLLLDEKSLDKKRHATYRYRWTKWWERQIFLRIEQHGSDDLDRCLIVFTQEGEVLKWMKGTVSDSASAPSSPAIMAIGYDPRDPRAFREYMIWIATGDAEGNIIQCEIKIFAKALKAHFDEIISTSTLCFVADATAGLGLDMVEQVAASSDAMIIPRPTWMAMLMQLQDLSKSTQQDIIEILCRLEAEWKVRTWTAQHKAAQIKSSASVQNVFRKTVIFTLPGQSTVPTLLPLLQAAFPCERHVFLYQGCRASVAHGMRKPVMGGTNRLTLDADLQTATPCEKLSSSVRTLPKALKQLSLLHASLTESWMSSVGTMLRLKDDMGDAEYLPFVCKWENLVDAAVASSESPLAVINLWQFVTGSRNRSLPETFVTEAVRQVQERSSVAALSLDPSTEKAIEDSVFQHKSILIGNKTLIDTVKPEAEWSLKAATKKSGCSCCAPEEGENEVPQISSPVSVTSASNDPLMTNTAGVSKVPSRMSSSSYNRRSHVDGRKTFAFDPTRFNMTVT